MARRGRTIYAPGQQVMFAPESEWRPPNLDDLPSWEGAKRVGIDTETRDPALKQTGIGVRRGGYVVGVSFAIEDGPSYYLPIRHDGGGNLDADRVRAYLRDQAAVFTGDIVGAHLQYDLDYLAEEQVVFRRARFFRDVQIADPLINELHYSYSLQSIAKRHDLLGKDEALLREAAAVYGIDPKSDMWRLHSKYVGTYATEDAVLPLRILRRQERLIDDEDLWEIYNLESRLLPVLVKMRRRGVRLDFDAMDRAEAYSLAEEQKALDAVHHKTGIQVGVGNVWSANAMAEPLRYLGLELGADKHGNPLVNEGVLKTAGEVGELLLRARKINKMRTTFVESMRRYETNGRIHATLNQLKRQKDDGSDDTQGAAYGRLSCVDPNLQQQPSPGRDPEIGGLVRSCYIADEGGVWSSNDYSQQEPKWLTHFAEICGLPRAKEAAEKYRNDPNADNHDMMTAMIYGDNIKKEKSEKEFYYLRVGSKTIFLGLCYGMGGKKLAISLGLPTRWLVSTKRNRYYFDFDEKQAAMDKARSIEGRIWEVAGEEAQALLDRFDTRVPYVRALADLAKKQAARNGFITTVLGRRCRFPVDEHGNFDWTHKGLNRLIQGSSGDQMKKAMIDADAEGFKLQIQVHDELGQTVSGREEAEALGQVMKDAVPCNVPHKVDVEIGANWGECG